MSANNAFLILNPYEASLVGAIAATFIPSDSNGPGAPEAGAVYFVDHALASEYGTNGNMYMQGPFIMPNLTSPITVDGIHYSGGSSPVRLGAGTRFQYPLQLRKYWKIGLEAFDTYCKSTYGGGFATLSAANQVAALTDLWNNKPTNFSYSIPGFKAGVTQAFNIIPQDFFYDLWILCWAGFLTDPVYGGNQNMVGWKYVAFNGTNQGNMYGEGLTVKQLMVATTPTRLQPSTLAQFQAAAGDTGALQTSTSSSSSSSTSSSSSGST